jgi:hypothetical protein
MMHAFIINAIDDFIVVAIDGGLWAFQVAYCDRFLIVVMLWT